MHIPLRLIAATVLGVVSIAGVYQSPTVDVKAAPPVKAPPVKKVSLTKPAKTAIKTTGETAFTMSMCDCAHTGKCTCRAADCNCPNCPVHHAQPRTFADVPQYKATDGRYYKIDGGKTFVYQPPVKLSCGPNGCTWSTGQWALLTAKTAVQKPTVMRQSTCGPGGCSTGTCSSGNCGGGRRFGRRF